MIRKVPANTVHQQLLDIFVRLGHQINVVALGHKFLSRLIVAGD